MIKDLLPEAIQCGITEKRFFKMTPAAIKRQIKAFWEQKKNDWERSEYESWVSGWYVMNAIACCISKKHKYPKNPMEQKQLVVEDMVLTEEEKDYYRDQFVKRLQRMENRFNKAKERENGFEIVKEEGK